MTQMNLSVRQRTKSRTQRIDWWFSGTREFEECQRGSLGLADANYYTENG